MYFAKDNMQKRCVLGALKTHSKNPVLLCHAGLYMPVPGSK